MSFDCAWSRHLHCTTPALHLSLTGRCQGAGGARERSAAVSPRWAPGPNWVQVYGRENTDLLDHRLRSGRMNICNIHPLFMAL